jgi:hypothetical protein
MRRPTASFSGPYRQKYFGGDAKGQIIFIIRCILESSGNKNALLVSSALTSTLTDTGLKVHRGVRSNPAGPDPGDDALARSLWRELAGLLLFHAQSETSFSTSSVPRFGKTRQSRPSRSGSRSRRSGWRHGHAFCRADPQEGHGRPEPMRRAKRCPSAYF